MQFQTPTSALPSTDVSLAFRCDVKSSCLTINCLPAVGQVHSPNISTRQTERSVVCCTEPLAYIVADPRPILPPPPRFRPLYHRYVPCSPLFRLAQLNWCFPNAAAIYKYNDTPTWIRSTSDQRNQNHRPNGTVARGATLRPVDETRVACRRRIRRRKVTSAPKRPDIASVSLSP